MAKTYEELLAGATQIKNNELPESNTHSLVGGQLLDMVEKNKDDKDKSDKKFTELENLTDKLSVDIYGRIISDWAAGNLQQSTGSFSTPSSVWSASDYVDISEFSEISFTQPTRTNDASQGTGMCFYDADKSYISGVEIIINYSSDGYKIITIKVPEGAKYARFMWWQDTETYGEFKILSLVDKSGETVSVLNSLKKEISLSVKNYTSQSDNLNWELGYQVIAVSGGSPSLGELNSVSSKREASDYYEIPTNVLKVRTTLIYPSSTTSNGGLVFYDAENNAIEGHYVNGNTYDGYKEVTIDVPYNAAYLRTTKWSYNVNVEKNFILDYIYGGSIIERMSSAEKCIGYDNAISVEQGTLDSSTGQPLTAQAAGVNHYNRLRSPIYESNISQLSIINNSRGSILCAIYYFDKLYGNVVDKIAMTSENVDLDSNYPYYKVVIKKNDGTKISPSDVHDVLISLSNNSINKRLSVLEKRATDIDLINNELYGETYDVNTTWTAGNLQQSTGSFSTPSSVWSASDFIDISGMKQITFSNPLRVGDGSRGTGMCFYDTDKSYISGHEIHINAESNGSEIITIDVPEGTKYARFMWWQDTETYGEFKILLSTGLIQEVENLKNNQGTNITSVKEPIIGSPAIYISTPVDDEDLNSKTCADVYELYDALASSYQYIFERKDDLGLDSSGLNQLRHYRMRIRNPYVSTSYDPSNQATNKWDENSMNLRTIIVMAGVHGNEKSSVYGLYYALKEILESNEEWATFIKSNFSIEIIPIQNPWGFDNNTRNNYNDVNINRDYYSSAPQAETKILKDFFASFSNLHAILDSHNSNYVTGIGSVNLGYISTKEDFDFHSFYCKTAAKIASATYSRNKELFSRSEPSPYITAWLSTNTGTSVEYINKELGILGGTLEAPMSDYGITSASDNNRAKWSEVSKNLIINCIQIYGSYNY